ncbi:MAG TPA: LysE family translocator [Roseomonas sp.]|nr:LysE family translocator [Roseomonas sp.]
MPDPQLFLAFLAAVTLMMLMPGPNVALIVANSVAHGLRQGLVTVAGTASAMVLQLTVTAIGMGGLLGRLGAGFELLRWVGVAYLLYLGWRQWHAPPAELAGVPAGPRSARRIWTRAFLVSLTNPKTLLFYGAFFPQFVAPERGLPLQLAVLSASFLAAAVLVDSGWAMAAARARHLLARHARLRNRLSGGLLMGAGLALAAVRTR